MDLSIPLIFNPLVIVGLVLLVLLLIFSRKARKIAGMMLLGLLLLIFAKAIVNLVWQAVQWIMALLPG